MADITMNIKDTRRIAILDRVEEKTMTQAQAAEVLAITDRQVRRLLKRYQDHGASGVIHKLRGLPGNHQADTRLLDEALDIVRQQYPDFSVTLAHEKLVKLHRFTYSRETLRSAMMEVGLWHVKRKPKTIAHPIRDRRECEGELVQIDGSPHDWFEGRAPYCTLLVFIDDATGKLKYLQFMLHETTVGYMAGVKHYLEENGKPQSLYSDRHSIFRVNSRKRGAAEVTDEVGITQFDRAMHELDIELIFANSPQAKGRVERMNETLQGRLPKEMRLLKINSLEEGNRYLPTYMEEFNKQFGVVAISSRDAHRPLKAQEKLGEVLVQKHVRIVSKSLTVSYENKLLQIKPRTGSDGRVLWHQRVEIRHDSNDRISISYQSRNLEYTVVKVHQNSHVVDSKRLNHTVDKLRDKPLRKYASPALNNPWRNFTFGQKRQLTITS